MLEGRKEGAASNTMIIALSSIRHHFKYDSVMSEMLHGPMITDALKICKRDGRQVKKKKPLTVEMITEMHQWHTSSERIRSESVGWTDGRDLGMIILMMTCFLRESEVIRILRREVRITPTTINGVQREILEVYIRKAKNDQAGQGHLIRVGDSTTNPICPVFWVKLLISRARPNTSLLIHTYKGDAMTSTTPCGIVQKWIKRINGSTSKFGDSLLYGSHSCRIGGVTAAHKAGIDMTLIQQHGNWKSDVVYDYIQPSLNQQLSVTSFIHTTPAS